MLHKHVIVAQMSVTPPMWNSEICEEPYGSCNTIEMLRIRLDQLKAAEVGHIISLDPSYCGYV